jgi:hypothetical protein
MAPRAYQDQDIAITVKFDRSSSYGFLSLAGSRKAVPAYRGMVLTHNAPDLLQDVSS